MRKFIGGLVIFYIGYVFVMTIFLTLSEDGRIGIAKTAFAEGAQAALDQSGDLDRIRAEKREKYVLTRQRCTGKFLFAEFSPIGVAYLVATFNVVPVAIERAKLLNQKGNDSLAATTCRLQAIVESGSAKDVLPP